MTEFNPYETSAISSAESCDTCCSNGKNRLTHSLIVGWLSSMIGPIFLTLYWLYHGLTGVLETPGAFLLFFLAGYITPALLCVGLGAILGSVLRKTGVPIMHSRTLSFMVLVGFLLSFFLANFLLLTNDQLNGDVLPPPITIPTFSATCGLGVLIATAISQLGSLSSEKRNSLLNEGTQN
jgi:hypothetical protein